MAYHVTPDSISLELLSFVTSLSSIYAYLMITYVFRAMPAISVDVQTSQLVLLLMRLGLLPGRGGLVHLRALDTESFVKILMNTPSFHQVRNLALSVVEEHNPSFRLSHCSLLPKRPHGRSDEVAVGSYLAQTNGTDDLIFRAPMSA